MSNDKPAGLDPAKTVIIVGENGIYKLTSDVWEKSEYELSGNPAALGVVNELANFGSYLSFVPDMAVGYGSACTIVNLKAILKNHAPAREASAGSDEVEE
jgi:hypothetical protein